MCDCDIEACGRDWSGVWPFHGWVAVFKSFTNCCASASLVLSVPVLTWPWDNIMIRFCCNCRYQMVVSVITWSIWRGRTCLSVCWQQTVEKPHNKRMVVVQQFYSYPSKHVWWCWEHDRVSAACRHRCCVKEASLHIISQQWVVACEAHSCSCWL